MSKAEPNTLFHGTYIDMMMLYKVRVINVPEHSRGKPQAKFGFYIDLSMFDVKKALELYTCRAQSEWKDWMDRVFNERGVYRDPFVGIAGHSSADVESMPPCQEAQAILSAVRNRRRPNRHGWNYKEDFERYLLDEEGNAFDTAEPRFIVA